MKIEKGQKYLHFKGREVKILELGKHSETLEEYVIYIHTNEENPTIWIRPIEIFQSKVDKVKYPNVTQEYRFERIEEKNSQ
jgi:hypothetical protein